MSGFVDPNILVRHLTGDPPEMAARATAFLATASDLLLTDLIFAETVYVLESFYETPRAQLAEAMRSLVAFAPAVCVDSALLLRNRGLRDGPARLCRGLPGGLRGKHWSREHRFVRPDVGSSERHQANRAARG